MRAPASWLGEWVDLPADVTPEHLHAALVKVGLEEEDVHGGGITGPVVVGRVVSLQPEPQSNGKTINWCQVDVGESEPRGIVCGAHNFAVGDKVVVTLPGAVLPGPFPIAARKTYGHVSDGMIASARELGLGDEHSGILRLAELGLDPAPGTDALPLLGLDDFAVEVNVTPDRGYAFSLRGIAREYALSTGAPFRDPADAVPALEEPAGFPVAIDDRAPVRGRVGCSVFTARVVRGIDPTAPTPAWMKARLELAGVRSISLAVDVTNYVMFELGQPTHGYDLAKITGGLTVRRAAAGERLETLDGVVRTLDPEDLVIADDAGAVGLAGVMGGAATEISDSTTDVLIEAAAFDTVTIARSVRRHKLPSEAAKRNERGVDPRMSPVAAARVAQLLVELGGGTIDRLGAIVDRSVAPAPIALDAGAASALTGVDYAPAEVHDTLVAIGAAVVETAAGWTVIPPSWRPDIVDAPSLIEEVARITGYDRIPATLPVAPPGRGLSDPQRYRRAVAQDLAASGLTEVLVYPWIAEEAARRYDDVDDRPLMVVENAIDPAAARMRPSLIPGLVETAHRNVARGLTDLALFEVGTVFRPTPGGSYGSGPLPVGDARPGDAVLEELYASIPPQPWHVGAVFVGEAVPRAAGRPAQPAGIADALAAAQQVAASVGVRLSIASGRHPGLHPGRTAALTVGDRIVGHAGELLPAHALEANLPRVVGVLELDLDLLIAAAPTDRSAAPIATFPAATQDVSLVVAVHVAAGTVHEALVLGAGELLESARLVDDYRGQGVPEGSKSLTFALRFRAADRTLTSEEATAAKLAGVALAAERTGATLRE